MSDMYQENILEHYHDPHNKRIIAKPSMHHRDLNPLCGDEIEIFIKVENGSIADISFQGQGCAISQASASMLTDELKGKPEDKIKDLNKDDILELLGIELSPVRLKCALLPIRVLKLAYYIKAGKAELDAKDALDDAGLGY